MAWQLGAILERHERDSSGPVDATNGPVTVTVDGVTSNAVSFSLLEGLSVTSISQNVGPVGTTVTISGTGFGPTQSNSIALLRCGRDREQLERHADRGHCG